MLFLTFFINKYKNVFFYLKSLLSLLGQQSSFSFSKSVEGIIIQPQFCTLITLIIFLYNRYNSTWLAREKMAKYKIRKCHFPHCIQEQSSTSWESHVYCKMTHRGNLLPECRQKRTQQSREHSHEHNIHPNTV